MGAALPVVPTDNPPDEVVSPQYVPERRSWKTQTMVISIQQTCANVQKAFVRVWVYVTWCGATSFLSYGGKAKAKQPSQVVEGTGIEYHLELGPGLASVLMETVAEQPRVG